MKKISKAFSAILAIMLFSSLTLQAQTLVEDWGLTSRGMGWPILNTVSTPAGDASMGSDGPPATWATIFGGFGQTYEATTEQAFVVTGKFEYVGDGPGESYVGLRYALTFQADSDMVATPGTVADQYTDSATWVDGGGHHYGYEFTPRSGTTDLANGGGGSGSIWTINGGGGWNSTWSNNGGPIGTVDQAPRRAVIVGGVYDFAISVQPLGDGTNEVRWFMFSEDQTSYWYGGTAIDTAQVSTKFNGIGFGVGDGITTNMTGFSLTEVTAGLGTPIEIPTKPFSSFYVDEWGALGRFGWPILNDTTTLVGDGLMGGASTPQGNWATIMGSFGENVSATETEAIIVTGQLEFTGSPTSWSALRYGLFNFTDPGDLNYQYTDSAKWGGMINAGTDSAAFVNGSQNAFGYMFSPTSGTNESVSGQGGLGTQWAVNGGSWISSWSGGSLTMGVVAPAPRRAQMTAGTYNFAISVQPLNDGTNEVRWYLTKGQNYWFGGTAIDTTQQVTEFNGVIFGINNGNGIADTDPLVTGLSVLAVKVDRGSPITVPVAPFSSFYVEDWGSTSRGKGWPILNDSTTIVGDAGMGSDGPPATWATIFGGFGSNVQATTDEAIVVTGQFEYVGDGPGSSYVGLRYALTFQADSDMVAAPGTLANQYTDSATWVDGGGHHYGYEFTPRSGTTDLANGGGGSGTIWTINGGGGWNSTWSNNGGPIGTVYQAPARAIIGVGVYDFAISVQPLADGTNEIRWYMFSEDKASYWFGGVAIDSAQVSTKFNGIGFGVGDGITTTMSGFNLIAVKVDRGTPITVPKAPWQAYYVDKWGFVGGKLGGWTLTPGEFIGNVSISGTAPNTSWSAVRGEFVSPITPEVGEALIVTGTLDFVGGGIEGWSGFRYGVYYSQTAGKIAVDSAADSSYVWNGNDNAAGYLIMPQSGTNTVPTWSGTEGTFGGVIGGPWNSTNNTGNYALGTNMQEPAGAVAGAGKYDFKISVGPWEDGTMEIRYVLEKQGGGYTFAGQANDVTDPLPAKMFNSINFALNTWDGSTTTGLDITDVKVDLGDPITLPDWVVAVNGGEKGLPTTYSLNQNYPNPFNPTTTIEFALPKNSDVKLIVYDILGSEVAQLVKGELAAGYHSINFDASHLASGIYFYSIKAGDFVSVKKLVLLK